MWTVLWLLALIAASGPHLVHHLPNLHRQDDHHSHADQPRLFDCLILSLMQHTPVAEGLLDTCLGHGQLSAEREIDLGQLSQSAKVWIRTPRLIQTSHTHLFGQTLIAGLLGGIFLLSSLGEGKKAVIVALPFVGTILDIGGMWLTRFVWQPFGVLVLIGGSMFALGYVLITVIALYELWLKREVHS